MSLNITYIDAAVDFAKVFLEDQFVQDTPDGTQFNRDHLKKLPPADRKVCFNALDLIKKATLPDFKNASDSIPEELKDRLTNLKLAIFQDIDNADDQSPAWWKTPFVKIAKLIHSIAVGILNIFGRVSTDKLFNKVEAYRRDHEEAQNRIIELEGISSDSSLVGEVQQAEEEYNNSIEAKMNFIHNEYNPNFESLLMLNRIPQEAPSVAGSDGKNLVDAKLEAFNRWTKNSATELEKDIFSTFAIKNFKDVVCDVIGTATDEVQEKLEELLNAAEDSNRTEEDVREKFNEIQNQVIDTNNNQLLRVGDQLHQNELDAMNKKNKLNEEAELLQKKYS